MFSVFLRSVRHRHGSRFLAFGFVAVRPFCRWLRCHSHSRILTWLTEASRRSIGRSQVNEPLGFRKWCSVIDHHRLPDGIGVPLIGMDGIGILIDDALRRTSIASSNDEESHREQSSKVDPLPAERHACAIMIEMLSGLMGHLRPLPEFVRWRETERD